MKKLKQHHEKALAIDNRTNRTYGSNHPNVGIVLYSLGLALMVLERYESAKENFLKALDIMQSKYGQNHLEVSRILNSLGEVQIKEKKIEEARETLDRALKSLEMVFPGAES